LTPKAVLGAAAMFFIIMSSAAAAASHSDAIQHCFLTAVPAIAAEGMGDQ
jgi:hypothetical protein